MLFYEMQIPRYLQGLHRHESLSACVHSTHGVDRFEFDRLVRDVGPSVCSDQLRVVQPTGCRRSAQEDRMTDMFVAVLTAIFVAVQLQQQLHHTCSIRVALNAAAVIE